LSLTLQATRITRKNHTNGVLHTPKERRYRTA
jgi:hypothetical protein